MKEMQARVENPQTGIASWFSASPPTKNEMYQQGEAINQLKRDLEKLKSNPPELAHVKLSEEMKLKIQEATKKIEQADINLKNLGGQLKIRRLKTAAERIKANITAMEKPMACMIKLAECKEVTGWDSIGKDAGKSCKEQNLSQGKVKATNGKCTALTVDSKWSEVDACISEYRRDILKKAGTEGLSAQFRACQKL